jgi:hypothetical protein
MRGKNKLKKKKKKKNLRSIKYNGYIIVIIAMTTSQVRIAQTMESFYDDSAPMGAGGAEYKRVVEKLDEEARSNLVC